MIRPNSPMITDADVYNVEKTLRSGNLAQGACVDELEKQIGAYHNYDCSVAFSSETAAFESVCAYIGLKPGDEVIVSPFTFRSIPYGIVRTGARPVFIDVKSNFMADWTLLHELLNENTKAIIITNLYGYADPDVEILAEICKMREIYPIIIEDNAQALGARYPDGTLVGTFGDFALYSFYATKNIAGGEGGIVVGALFEEDFFRGYRNNGIVMNPSGDCYLGVNYRMTDIEASLALSQFSRIDQMNNLRRLQAAVYNNTLEIPNFQSQIGDSEHVYHQYTIILPPNVSRGKIIDAMRKEGIELGVYYDYLTNYDPFFDELDFNDTPMAWMLSQSCVSLPIGPWLSAYHLTMTAELLNEKIANESAAR